MAASYQIANNAWGNVASAVAAGDTTIALTSGQGQRFPSTASGNWFYATMIDSNGVVEIVKCTNRNVDVLTVVRGQDGTLAKSFTAGSAIEARLVAAIFNVDNPVRYASRDGSLPMLGNLDFGSFRGINLATPTVASDAVRKDYVDNLVASSIAQAMPHFAVTMLWSGTIPTGWALCNGANGTPNMLDRFPVCAGSSYGNGSAGGEVTHTLSANEMPNHGHSAWTDTQGAHAHSGSTSGVGDHQHVSGVPYDYNGPWGQNNTGQNLSQKMGTGGTPLSPITSPAGNHAHSFSTDTQGAHAHNVGIGATGGGGAHENRPPFIGIYFIMKMY